MLCVCYSLSNVSWLDILLISFRFLPIQVSGEDYELVSTR